MKLSFEELCNRIQMAPALLVDLGSSYEPKRKLLSSIESVGWTWVEVVNEAREVYKCFADRDVSPPVVGQIVYLCYWHRDYHEIASLRGAPGLVIHSKKKLHRDGESVVLWPNGKTQMLEWTFLTPRAPVVIKSF